MSHALTARRTAALLVVAAALAIPQYLMAQDQADGWPREIETDSAVVTMYQPQIDSLKGDRLFARSAISVATKPKGTPTFGAAWSTMRMTTERDSGLVRLTDVDITRIRFPEADSAKQAALETLIERVAAASWTLTTSLESIRTSLAASEQERGSAKDLKFDPPTIVFARTPTVLVVIDGTPQMRGLPNSSFQRVINTPYAIVYDPGNQTYYLNGGRFWYSAPAATGPFNLIDQAPEEVAKLAPPDSSGALAADTGAAPAVMVATTPTELVSTVGDPVFAPLPGTDLLYVTNTESDVFKDIANQDYYLLLSGRWYASQEVSGPWRYIPPDSVPRDFAQISPNGVKGRVLISVPGTTQADDAVADAAVPQTAAISRKDASLDVSYDGDPRFEAVTGTGILYAVNTATSVLKINGRYYACSDAVWYVSDNATGPWVVSDSVPESVQSIPPSNPLYNVKYVHVYQSTPDEVYVGYTPGYVGMYPYDGTVVYGTGWYYPPYYSPYYYYPYPYTWGFCAHYSPWGGWGFGYGWNYGFMYTGVAWGGYYRPPGWHGGWYGGGWYGPGGYRPPAYRPRGGNPPPHPGGGYRPRTLTGRGNIYSRPEVRPAVSTRPIHREPGIASGKRNNVYVDREGNVHRRTDGGWEHREGGNWKPVSRPAVQPGNPGLRPVTGGGAAVNPGTGTRPPTGYQQPQVNPGTGNRPAPRPYTGDANRRQLERDYQARQRAGQYSRPSGPPMSRPSGPPMSRPGGPPMSRPSSPPAARRR
jgi:hypothetical protein